MGSAATAAALQPQPAVDGSNGLLAGLTTLAVDTAGPSQGGNGSGTETGGVPPPGIKAHLPPGTKAGDASSGSAYGGVPPPGIKAHLLPGTKAGDASGGSAYGGVFAHEATKFQYREAKRKVRQSQKVR